MKNRAYKDEEYLRGVNKEGRPIPFTKYDYRLATLSHLFLEPDDVVLDIGAGTGGLTCEAARRVSQGKVYAIERDKEAWRLINENTKKLGLNNVEVIQDHAQNVLENFKVEFFDKIIIGGSGSRLDEILSMCQKLLKPDGILVANFITLENAVLAKKLLTKYFEEVHLRQLMVSVGKNIGNRTMMKAQNPIIIITAEGKQNVGRRRP